MKTIGVCIVNGLLSAFLTPKSYDGHYLNVNFSHEMWKDIKIGIHSYYYYYLLACLLLLLYLIYTQKGWAHSFNPDKGYPWPVYFVFAIWFCNTANFSFVIFRYFSCFFVFCFLFSVNSINSIIYFF